MDSKVDSKPNEHGCEDDGQQREIADGQGRQREGQEDGDGQGQDAEEGFSKTPEEDDEERENANQGHQGSFSHVLVRGHHFVSLEDGPSGQAQLDLGVGALHIREDFADFKQRFTNELNGAGVFFRQDLDKQVFFIFRRQVAALAQRAALFSIEPPGQAVGLPSFQGREGGCERMLQQRDAAACRVRSDVVVFSCCEAPADLLGIKQSREEGEEPLQAVGLSELFEQVAVSCQGRGQDFQLFNLPVKDAVAHRLGRYAIEGPLDVFVQLLHPLPDLAGGRQGGLLVLADLNHDIEELKVAELFQEIQVPAIIFQVRSYEIVLVGLELDLQHRRNGPYGQGHVEPGGQPGMAGNEG